MSFSVVINHPSKVEFQLHGRFEYKTASVCEFKEQQRLLLEYHCSHTLVLVNSECGLSDC